MTHYTGLTLAGSPGPPGPQGPALGYTAVNRAGDTMTGDLITRGPIYDVRAFGALGNGVTDDTAAINAAIAALPTPGGTVYLPAAVYVVNGTVSVVDRNGVTLRGDGANHEIYGGAPTTGTVLKRVSGVGTLVNFATTAALTTSIQNCSIEGMSLNGNALAATVLKLTSVYGSRFRDIHIRNGTTVGLDCTTIDLAGVDDTQMCLFEQITIRQKDGAGSSGIGMRLGSVLAGVGNTSGNTFTEVLVYHHDGVGVQLNDADSNHFFGLVANQSAPGSGIGLELNGTNAVSSGNARSNLFLHAEFAGGVTARGTGFTRPSVNNVLIRSTESLASTVTVETGADLTVLNMGGRTVGFKSDYTAETPPLVDDFDCGVNGNGGVGRLGWGVSGTGTVASVASESGRHGLVRLSTGAGAGTLCHLHLGLNGTGSVWADDQWDIRFLLRMNTVDADTQVRIGLSGSGSGDPDANGVYFEKLYADLNYKFVTRSAGVQTRTSWVGYSAGAWYYFRLRRINATTIGYTGTGSADITQTTNIPTGIALQPFVQIKNQSAVNKTMDVDFFELGMGGLAR